MFWRHGDISRLGLRCEYLVRFFIWKGIGLHNYDKFAFGNLLIALTPARVQEDVHEGLNKKMGQNLLLKLITV